MPKLLPTGPVGSSFRGNGGFSEKAYIATGRLLTAMERSNKDSR